MPAIEARRGITRAPMGDFLIKLWLRSRVSQHHSGCHCVVTNGFFTEWVRVPAPAVSGYVRLGEWVNGFQQVSGYASF